MNSNQSAFSIGCNVHPLNPGQPTESAKTIHCQWCTIIKCTFHENHDQLPLGISIICIIITPRTCARGKAIGFVCRLSSVVCRLSSVVTTKIARSRVLGICAYCNYNESVDIDEKLVSAGFELLNMTHWCYKSCIFHSACLWFTDCTHSMCDVTRLRMLDFDVGKGRQVMKCI